MSPMSVWSATQKRACRRSIGDLLEADFWPGIISGSPMTRKESKEATANRLRSWSLQRVATHRPRDPRLQTQRPKLSFVCHDCPANSLAFHGWECDTGGRIGPQAQLQSSSDSGYSGPQTLSTRVLAHLKLRLRSDPYHGSLHCRARHHTGSARWHGNRRSEAIRNPQSRHGH